MMNKVKQKAASVMNITRLEVVIGGIFCVARVSRCPQRKIKKIIDDHLKKIKVHHATRQFVKHLHGLSVAVNNNQE